jgi:hypothetical protein
MEVASENFGSSRQGCCVRSDECAGVVWSWKTTHGCLRILALAIDLRHATDGDGWSGAAGPVAWVRWWLPADWFDLGGLRRWSCHRGLIMGFALSPETPGEAGDGVGDALPGGE